MVIFPQLLEYPYNFVGEGAALMNLQEIYFQFISVRDNDAVPAQGVLFLSKAQPKALDCLGFNLVVSIPGARKVHLCLLNCLHVERAVTLDLVQEFSWPHIVEAKTDVLKVLIQC